MRTRELNPFTLLSTVVFTTVLFLCSNAAAFGEKATGTEEPFCIVVLPDTQVYAWRFPRILYRQTQWIVENRSRYNIRYVLHLGDVVQHNSLKEWKVARRAFALLDGKVPYAIALGNHDLGPGGRAESRATLFNDYFPLTEFRKWPTFGGVYDKEATGADNSYHLFGAGGKKWLVLALEFGPRDDVLRWANQIVSRYPDHLGILITHAYLDNNGRRYARGVKGQTYPPYLYPLARSEDGLNDGEDIWRKLVSKHANMAFVLCGHVCVAARLESRGDAGNVVHQMLVDYQTQDRGGNGWLRLMRFQPSAGTVKVQDYSPVLDQWADDPDRRFVLRLSDTHRAEIRKETPGQSVR